MTIFTPLSRLDPELMMKQIDASLGLGHTIFTPATRLDPELMLRQIEAAEGKRLFTPMTRLDPELMLGQVDAVASGGGNPYASIDGSLNAPSGPAQYPSLLNGYVARPPWKVAGVDYAVGVPPGTVLKDPSNPANLPAGATFSSPSVHVNSNNVTLDSLDFNVGGAHYGVALSAVLEPAVRRSKILRAVLGSLGPSSANAISCLIRYGDPGNRWGQ